MVEFSIENIRESLVGYFKYFPQSWTISASILIGTLVFLFLVVLIVLRVGVFKGKIDYHQRLPLAIFLGSILSSLILTAFTVQGALYDSWIIVGDYQSTFVISFLISILCLVYSFWWYSNRNRRVQFLRVNYQPSERIYRASLEQHRKRLRLLRFLSFALLLPLVFTFTGGKNKFIYSFVIDNSVSMRDYGAQVTESVRHINEKTQGEFDMVFSYFSNSDATAEDYPNLRDLSNERNPDLINFSETRHYEKSNDFTEFLDDLDNSLYNYEVRHTPLLMCIKQNALRCSELFADYEYSRKVLFLISDGYSTNPNFKDVSEELWDPLNWKSPEYSAYDNFDQIILVKVDADVQNIPENSISIFDYTNDEEKVVPLNLEDSDSISELIRDYTYQDFKDYDILLILGFLALLTIITLFIIKI